MCPKVIYAHSSLKVGQVKTMGKYVYTFEEGSDKDEHLLGGKGAGLCGMTKLGLPVPPGFVISTKACVEYYNKNKKLPDGLMDEVKKSLKIVEKQTGKGFGNVPKPLLISVRSGAPVSMPGMMDSILDLGLNDDTLKGLIKQTNNPHFVYDSYRRFISMFCKIVFGVDGKVFDEALNISKKKMGIKLDYELSVDALKALVDEYKKICKRTTGNDFPSDVYEQLELSIRAVFDSWMGKRCVDYRREFKITKDVCDGTAVNVCTMVFGNLGNDSATGVAFTRNPETGENMLYGEYLINAQGEDVVAGVRTPRPILELKKEMPEIYESLLKVRNILEKHYLEPQDFEFTIEYNRLYLLQTRAAKMGPNALVKTLVDMVKEGLITKEKAILKVKPEVLEQLMHRRIDPKNENKPISRGLPASPGAAVGKVVFDADEAERRGKIGERVILVREETKPEDVHGFFSSQGILTSRGGKTSHAAVVARGIGKPCVTGAEGIVVNQEVKTAAIGDIRVAENDIITIDGTTGNIFLGEIKTIDPEISEELFELLAWADNIALLEVRANANTPEEAVKAKKFGAKGIGLCRTERMFNIKERLPIMQEMILAENKDERDKAIKKLLPLQREDFKEILKSMEGLPVTIRLLDPPLHEFLPRVENLIREIDSLKYIQETLRVMEDLPEAIKISDYFPHKDISEIELGLSRLNELKKKKIVEKLVNEKEGLLKKVSALTEVNPMLGHRGVRIGITYPEIYEMQIRAIFEATTELINEGVKVIPEIMVPQVCTAQELKWVHGIVVKVKEDVEKQAGVKISYKFGTMIEVVRACMRAGHLAEIADFFSFGTNDLTQATFSFSREDAENKFLPLYNERKILQDNPFETLDVKGVGRLMRITVEWGRKTNSNLKIGICGEHGGNPRSIQFCNEIGVNYVSCSPYRIPIARLVSAQAKLKGKEQNE